MIKFTFERDENSFYMGDYVSGVNNVTIEYDTDSSRKELIDGFNALLKVVGYEPVVDMSDSDVNFDDLDYKEWEEQWNGYVGDVDSHQNDYSEYSVSLSVPETDYSFTDSLTLGTPYDTELTYEEHVSAKNNPYVLNTEDINDFSVDGHHLGDVSISLTIDEEEK